MSQALALLAEKDPRKKLSRTQTIALAKAVAYTDGRTKQCHKDECDINKIMARFEVTGTISHLEKYEGVYADFSDFDFHEQTNKLTRGREIFDDLPAEIRREFSQNPAEFFQFVNDPANADELRKKLPALAKPGQQLNPKLAATEPTEAVEPDPAPAPDPEPT